MLTSGSRPRLAALLPAVVAVGVSLALTGCSQVTDAAQEQVDNAVANATSQAIGAVEEEVQQQAESLLQESLAGIDSTCTEFLGAAEAERTAVLGGLLQGFWLTELATTTPSVELIDSYSAAVVSGCEAAPDTAVTAVAQTIYDSGSYGPPQG